VASVFLKPLLTISGEESFLEQTAAIERAADVTLTLVSGESPVWSRALLVELGTKLSLVLIGSLRKVGVVSFKVKVIALYLEGLISDSLNNSRLTMVTVSLLNFSI
jgi:hypothetical protein